MQNVSLKSLQEDAADDISRRHKQTTFSDADFLGTLRLKHLVLSREDIRLEIQTAMKRTYMYIV